MLITYILTLSHNGKVERKLEQFTSLTIAFNSPSSDIVVFYLT